MKAKKKNYGGGSGPKRGRSSSSSSSSKLLPKRDPFFSSESKKKRRKMDYEDLDIESSGGSGDEEDNGMIDTGGGEEDEEEEEEEETADEKRQRMAKALLEKLRAIEKKKEDDEEEGEDDEGERVYEKEGERDSLVAQMLLNQQLVDSGRLRRTIASRVQKPASVDGFKVLVKHRHSVTAVRLFDDDTKGVSASKDGTILLWDVESGKGGKFKWPNDEVLRSHGAKPPDGRAAKHSRNVLALAVSSDGRYLASGGLDRHVHLWDTRTQEHVQAFPGHRGPVSCLTFRQGSSELFSGSFDRSIKIWNVEDRAYINTLFGHQSEVLTIDCLRKERVLAAGRDRTMQLFKVPEESRLIFRASASSLECCCFIDNDEFLSGSDDGNIELWGIQKKKPVYVVKNAHALLSDIKNGQHEDNANGHIGGRYSSAYSWVSSVAVCKGSDLAASGAGNGCVQLWAIESVKGIRPLYDLPLVGFVNSLDFAQSGNFVVAGVGQEPRLGRWGRIPSAQNGVSIQRLKHQ